MDTQIPFLELNAKRQEVFSWHNYIEVVFILKGTGTLKINKKQYSVSMGDLFVINIGQLHNLYLADAASSLSLNIPLEFLSFFAPEDISHFWECFSFLSTQNGQHYFNQIRTIFCSMFLAKEDSSSLTFRNSTLKLLDLLDRYFLQSTPNNQLNRNKQLPIVFQYLADNYRKDISLADAASIVHFSEAYLSRLLKKELGLTFKQYLTLLRTSQGASFLRNTEESITSIAYSCGFNSTNAFITAFKSLYLTTPGKYRKDYLAVRPQYTAFDEPYSSDLFSELYKFKGSAISSNQSALIQTVRLDVQKKGEPLSHNWKKLINIAYAHDLLSARIQSQLSQVQKDIHFSMARFLGITSDSMLVFNSDNKGNVSFYFDLVDEILDFLLSIDLKPYIVLGFMPEKLAHSSVKAYFNPIYVSMPNDMNLWLQMIDKLINHLLDRYGAHEIYTWIFEIWSHPEVGEMISSYTKEDFFEFYKQTFFVIKNVDSNIRIAGPDCRIDSWQWNEDFIIYSQNNHCFPDILCYESFNFENKENCNSKQLRHREDTLNHILSKDLEYLKKQRQRLNILLTKYNIENMPVILSTWNNTSWQRDFTNDTAHKAAFIFNDLWNTYDQWDSVGYWFFFDYVTLDELPPAAEIFHGGFGLISSNGIPKSGYRALQLLLSAQNTLIYRNENIAITSSHHKMSIFLFNCTTFTDDYCYQKVGNINSLNRYQVFEKIPSIHFRLKLYNLPSGFCKIKTHIIGKSFGSSYDKWIDMGAPINMDDAEVKYLLNNSYPNYTIERIAQNGELNIEKELSEHEVGLIEILFEDSL